MRLHLTLSLLGFAFWFVPVSPAADTQPAATSAPQIIGGPYLQTPSPTSMTLVWLTDKKCVSKVEYALAADERPKVAVSAHHGLIDANITLHRITLSGLEPGTTYRYRAISTEIVDFKPYSATYGQKVSRDGQFTTLDPRKESFSFCVLNDRHDRMQQLRQGLAAIPWNGVDLVFGLGDVMNDPMTEEQIFRNFINPCVESFAGRIPLVFVRGNHETRGALARNLLDYFPTPSGRYYYSFDHGGVHFLLLDGGEDKADDSSEYSGLVAFDEYLRQETEWLKEELQTAAFREARFRVCLLHIPPVVDHDDAPTKFIRPAWLRDHWGPLLNAAGVDVMISGHTHRYAEVPADAHRLYPIVVGGTDTVIRVDVAPERLRLTTFKNDGTVLSKPPEVLPKR